MKFSNYKNEEAAEKLIEFLELAEPIMNDKEVLAAMSKNAFAAAKVMLKNHSKEVIDILAFVDDIPREKYTVSPLGIFKKTVKLLSEEETVTVFTSPEQETQEVEN